MDLSWKWLPKVEGANLLLSYFLRANVLKPVAKCTVIVTINFEPWRDVTWCKVPCVWKQHYLQASSLNLAQLRLADVRGPLPVTRPGKKSLHVNYRFSLKKSSLRGPKIWSLRLVPFKFCLSPRLYCSSNWSLKPNKKKNSEKPS